MLPKEEAKTEVCDDILLIVEEYDRQNKYGGGIDSPGGLEHMGDVWKQLQRWAERLKA